MKKTIVTILTIFTVFESIAGATLPSQSQEALNQLAIARSEINTVRLTMPDMFKKLYGQSLQNAENRIAYAQSVLQGSVTADRYFCVLKTPFNGQFSAKGQSELEARTNVFQVCASSLKSDFWCKNNAQITCTQQ